MEETSTYGAVILSLLKAKLGIYLLWKQVEPQLAVYCSRIPQTNTLNGKEKVVTILKDVKSYLIGQGTDATELSFLDEEIERYDRTVQICKFDEKEDAIDPNLVRKYAALTNEEGVIGIHIALNYEQLKRLTNGVYALTKLIKFYISPEITLAGKIVAEIFEQSQEIPVATLAQPKKEDKSGPGDPTVFLFGEKIPKLEYVKVKEVKIPFYIYRFITESNQEYVLMSIEQQTIGDYIIQGMATEVDDFKAVSESSKIPTKLPYFFVQTIRNRIIKFHNHGELKEKLGVLNITKGTIFNYLFSVNKDGQKLIMRHPTWFKWLIWSWLTHAKYGLTTSYPMHLMIIGDPSSGKSTLLNTLHCRTREINPLFSGVSSTLKDLVPSFKYRPAKLGYLAESNRYSFLDEFLRCIIRMRAGKDSVDEELAIMNDLLEHQKRRAGSGVSQVNVNMTSRVMATTNPVREVHSVTDLVNKFDKSFNTRWLIYYQPRSHVDLIRSAEESELQTTDYYIGENDFVSILDYLHTFKAEFDSAPVMQIYNEVLPLLNKDLLDHYTARHKHHLYCLMDGIIKSRCLFEHDMSFRANKEDYEMLRNIWSNIIRSWIDGDTVDNLPLEFRRYYIPESSQYLFDVICKQSRPIPKFEIEELVKSELTKQAYISAMMILIRAGLVIEREFDVIPYYFKEKELGE